jgi:ribosomal protein L34E
LQQYETPEALRAFLRLCLDPGHGIKRSPEKLAEVLPEPLLQKVVEFAPHLGVLRDSAVALDQQTTHAFRAYADALAAWIKDEEPKPGPMSLASKCFDCRHTLNWHKGKGRCSLAECTCDQFQGERYVIGRNGVFATLYDWQEHRLVVDNATEAYCRRVRDALLNKPAPQPLPLLEAVTVAYEAAVTHIDGCTVCRPDMRLAEMCPAGQRAAIDSLDTVPTAATSCVHDDTQEFGTMSGLIVRRRCAHCGEPLKAVADPECAHLAWEVTSEHRNELGTWTKFRRCADCGERLEPIVESEPHCLEHARQHPVGL